jgi:Zincin-like metallopeptidase
MFPRASVARPEMKLTGEVVSGRLELEARIGLAAPVARREMPTVMMSLSRFRARVDLI